jgi:hypothetical protein
MKKIIFSLLAFSLLSLCFSENFNAQSAEQDLDQVELMKQFTGTWKYEGGVDTTQFWEAIPLNKGYETKWSSQINGETFITAKGLIGFTPEDRNVTWCSLWEDGMTSRDFGKFVSDKKLVMERYDINLENVTASYELSFVTPDEIKFLYKRKVLIEGTWQDGKVTERILTRIEK